MITRAIRGAIRFPELLKYIQKIGTARSLEILRRVEEIGFDSVTFTLNIVSTAYGHDETVRSGRPVDGSGKPLPWYTYPAIEYLQQIDFSGKHIFEFGSGYGSLFWADRAASVTSVENDPQWHSEMVSIQRPNQRIILETSKESYISALERSERADFDVIIIDGMYRLSCASIATKHLSAGGIVILDNSDWFPKTASLLRESSFYQVDFFGLGPVNRYTWATTLFIPKDARLTFKDVRHPRPPIYGLDQCAVED